MSIDYTIQVLHSSHAEVELLYKHDIRGKAITLETSLLAGGPWVQKAITAQYSEDLKGYLITMTADGATPSKLSEPLYLQVSADGTPVGTRQLGDNYTKVYPAAEPQAPQISSSSAGNYSFEVYVAGSVGETVMVYASATAAGTYSLIKTWKIETPEQTIRTFYNADFQAIGLALESLVFLKGSLTPPGGAEGPKSAPRARPPISNGTTSDFHLFLVIREYDLIEVSWPQITGATSYVLQAALKDTTAWVDWVTLPADRSSYSSRESSSPLGNATAQRVRVVAKDGASVLEESHWSFVCRFDPLLPSNPSEVLPVVNGNSRTTNGFQLQWKAVPGAIRYNVYLSQSDLGPWTKIDQMIPEDCNDSRFFYWVSSFNTEAYFPGVPLSNQWYVKVLPVNSSMVEFGLSRVCSDAWEIYGGVGRDLMTKDDFQIIFIERTEVMVVCGFPTFYNKGTTDLNTSIKQINVYASPTKGSRLYESPTYIKSAPNKLPGGKFGMYVPVEILQSDMDAAFGTGDERILITDSIMFYYSIEYTDGYIGSTLNSQQFLRAYRLDFGLEFGTVPEDHVTGLYVESL